jgi:alpha-beta hydrolase superfamily lysophospholipase
MNAAFPDARTDYDFLSRDPGEVDNYVADPLCGFGIDSAALRGWVANAARLADATEVGKIRDGFPIYLLAGSDDVGNANYVWLDKLADRYSRAGLTVTKAYYDGGRHEMLNETNREEVMSDLVTWLCTLPGLRAPQPG